jgi:7,8-dihydropterin-6-yl-methyl-4-(beta-D-ribofuranosyl)aminobenzene 5'-phosphate synthase
MGKRISILKIIIALCSLFIFLALAYTIEKNRLAMQEGNLVITTLFDNYEYKEGLKTGWGFSALIEYGDQKILFDTGASGAILLENIEALGLEPEDVEAIVISHDHGDHTGGLKGFLKRWGTKKVYIPKSFAAEFKDTVGENAELVAVKESVNIIPDIFSTGEMGTSIIEQSLIIETDKGLIVITGCAHPGIVDIVKKSKELRKKDLYLVMGGFHLRNKSDKEMEGIIEAFRSMGVKKVSPTHCTGDHQIELFKKEYGKNFIKNGVGKKLIIE